MIAVWWLMVVAGGGGALLMLVSLLDRNEDRGVTLLLASFPLVVVGLLSMAVVYALNIRLR